MFVTGMTGCNHLFDQEPRGLPKGSIDREARATILLSRRSTASALCLAGKHLLPNCPNRLPFPVDLACLVAQLGSRCFSARHARYKTLVCNNI